MGLLSLFIEDIFNLLEKKVKSYIIEEITNCKILNEFDLQCRFVSYLRENVEKFRDDRWSIFNTFYLKAAKKIPDVLIFLNYKPVIFIEIKYYGFNHPNRDKILRDLDKLHEYFNIYSLTIKRGYSFNIFTYSKEKFDEFNKTLNNRIQLKYIKVLNINLREVDNYHQVRNKVLERITRLTSNLKERE